MVARDGGGAERSRLETRAAPVATVEGPTGPGEMEGGEGVVCACLNFTPSHALATPSRSPLPSTPDLASAHPVRTAPAPHT